MKIGEQQYFALMRIEALVEELRSKRVRMENFRLLNESERILRMAVEHGDEKGFVEEYGT